MAEETQNSDANAQSAKGGGSGGMLPALLVIVLMPLISFAMFKFMFIPMIKAEIPEPGEPADINPADVHVKTDGELEMQKYDFDKVVANIKGTNMTRFVQAEITVYGSHPQMENKITENLE